VTAADVPAGRFGVKAGLTLRRRSRPVVENDDFGAFARRIVRAYGRCVAAGDPDALAALVALGAEIDAATAAGVAGLRAAGYSWADIAARLGVTRQAAQQRWGGEPR
jgi:hypothetical protein